MFEFDRLDLDHPYLTTNIIAYIGNKRRLLPLIVKAVRSCMPEGCEGAVFFDAFAGSGVVSRLAAFLGCSVHSNDWEAYAYVLGRAFTATSNNHVEDAFGSLAAFAAELERINGLALPGVDEQYIARYYAPSHDDIDKADWRTERLFYTRQNALRIDATRNYISAVYGRDEAGVFDQDRIHDLLLGLLLYQAATHTNTSGVFKAFHKGFGGHGRDAMRRILSPISLKMPELFPGRGTLRVYCEDALGLASSGRLGPVDIAYLDPPYNQHQYGSNYHLLNTITRWDKLPQPLELDETGVLKRKAAIRSDWGNTRSLYCSRNSAAGSFKGLMQALDARYILVSYSTDGLIPFELMCSICEERGKLTIVTNEYTKYRGGRQSNSRKNENIEFVLIVDTNEETNEADRRILQKTVQIRKLKLLFKNRFRKKCLCEKFSFDEDENIVFHSRKGPQRIGAANYFELDPPGDLYNLDVAAMKELSGLLESCVCNTKEQELEELLRIVTESGSPDKHILKMIPLALKKLAHKKYRPAYKSWLQRVRSLRQTAPEVYSLLGDKIDAVEAVALRRFEG